MCLLQIGVARLNSKGRLEPSPTGAFIAALPISLESALMFVRGGKEGSVWEAAVLAALMNTTPYPIKQPFGSQAMQYVRLYYYGSQHTAAGAAAGDEAVSVPPSAPVAVLSEWGVVVDYEGSSGGDNTGSNSLMPDMSVRSQGAVDRSVVLLANLSAFESWQMHWCDVQRLKQLLQQSQHSSADASSDDQASAGHSSDHEDDDDDVDAGSVSGSSLLSPAVDSVEAEWCQQHHLVPSSLRHVLDTVNTILAAVHKFRPSFVNNMVGPPQYYLTGVSGDAAVSTSAGRTVLDWDWQVAGVSCCWCYCL